MILQAGLRKGPLWLALQFIFGVAVGGTAAEAVKQSKTEFPFRKQFFQPAMSMPMKNLSTLLERAQSTR